MTDQSLKRLIFSEVKKKLFFSKSKSLLWKIYNCKFCTTTWWNIYQATRLIIAISMHIGNWWIFRKEKRLMYKKSKCLCICYKENVFKAGCDLQMLTRDESEAKMKKNSNGQRPRNRGRDASELNSPYFPRTPCSWNIHFKFFSSRENRKISDRRRLKSRDSDDHPCRSIWWSLHALQQINLLILLSLNDIEETLYIRTGFAGACSGIFLSQKAKNCTNKRKKDRLSSLKIDPSSFYSYRTCKRPQQSKIAVQFIYRIPQLWIKCSSRIFSRTSIHSVSFELKWTS